MKLLVRPAERITGRIAVPGDKSISHRALILGSIAKGETKIKNFLDSLDCQSTLNCMRSLGVSIQRVDDSTLVIDGVGLRGLKEPEEQLDCGNSGTTMRLLAGLLAGQRFYSVLTGDESLRRRPMRRVIDPLRKMGAQIWGREDGGFAPLSIKGEALKPIDYAMPIASAQVKSAILLAGLYAAGETTVKEPSPTRDHTERMLKLMGKELKVSNSGISIVGGSELEACEFAVPGDISSAAYLLVAAAIVDNSKLLIEGVGVNPTRSGIIEALRKMGARLATLNERIISNEPVADLEVESSELQGIEISGEMVPLLIDELPVIAVAATQAEGTTIVRDAAELRVKETDRIRATVKELSKMGARIEEREDGFVVEGPTRLHGTRCQSYGDHRIALSLTVAGLVAEGETIIEGAECIDVSFPGFIKFFPLGNL